MRPTRGTQRPAKSILDATFQYRPSHATDVRETFERARRELEQKQQRRSAEVKVLPLTRKEQQ